MNLRVVSYLSLVGAAMAFAAVYVIPERIEHYVWILVFAFCGFVLAHKTDKKFFLNGFVLGIIDTVLTILIRIYFYNRYLALNPGIPERDSKILASGVTPQMAMLLSAPVIAIFTGIVQGSFALIIARFTVKGQHRGKY